MAAYVISDFTFGPGDLASVAAEIETQLEALDSTSNPIEYIDVFQNVATGQYEGVLIVQGTP